MLCQQHVIDHPGDHSFVMLRVLRSKQPKQVMQLMRLTVENCDYELIYRCANNLAMNQGLALTPVRLKSRTKDETK